MCAKRDNNTKVVLKSLPCICCGAKIKSVAASGGEEEITVNTINFQNFNGMASRISCGFGSVNDGRVFMTGGS
jgi:hypothetical protein